MKPYFNLPILTIALFSSCQKEIRINLPKDLDRPVLNVLMTESRILKARLTLSGRPAEGEQFQVPEQAEAKLYENDVFREVLQKQTIDEKKYYVSTTKVQKDKKYRITATLPGYGLIEGSDSIPDISTVEINNESVIVANSNTYKLKFNFLLKNNSREKQYYRFRILYQNSDPKNNSSDKIPLEFRPVNTSDLFGSSNGEKKFWFIEKPQSAGETIFYSFTADSNPKKPLALEVTILTESAYKYLKSVAKAEDSQDSPFAEKVIIYSNIKNGLGIVGGLSFKEFPFPAK